MGYNFVVQQRVAFNESGRTIYYNFIFDIEQKKQRKQKNMSKNR